MSDTVAVTRTARTTLIAGVLALVAVLVIIIVIASVTSHTSDPTFRAAAEAENVTFWYESLKPADLTRLGHPRMAVLSRQEDGKSAVKLVHELGAVAFQYFQPVWVPVGKPLEGLDLTIHPDWAMCTVGATPMIGRHTDTPWYYIDANERAAYDALVADLRHIRDDGYDGVFFDLGDAALATGQAPDGAPLPSKHSSCTADPVHPGASFADSYVALLVAARQLGLQVFLNYPDPHGARPLRSDADRVTDYLLDEMSNASLDPSTFGAVMAANQRDLADGRVIEYLKTSAATTEQAAHDIGLAWARAKLAGNVPVATDSGDDNCHGNDPGGSNTCHRHGIFPELVDTRLGAPIDAEPMRVVCDQGSDIACLYVRRYHGGLVAVNLSAIARSFGSLDLGVGGCRLITDVLANTPVAEGRCAAAIDASVNAGSGAVYRYST